jgi:SecD/SecF fusion protein
MLATAGVKGFAFTLLIGTLVSLLTAVVATQAVLSSISRWKILRSNWALRLGSKDRQMRFDYTGASNWFFSMSGVILAAGAIAISVFGINFGIDFTSGTRITTPLEQSASVTQVREALAPLGYDGAKIQTVDDPELGPNVVQISTGKLDPARVNAVENALDDRFGVNSGEFSASSVGPTFGQEIARTAIIAIIASLFVISLYIGLRFEFKFAVPVLIALAHDLLITAGVYALFQLEVTTSTVAALLTILGYSLYDTIIVFDRIRENVPRMPRATFSQIVNRSMSEVIVRSLATSLSTLLPITALMVAGGETLQDFGFALLVGVISGTYSSVFIAAPVLVHWKEREPIWRRRDRMVREQHGGLVPAYADGAVGDEGEAVAAEPVREPASPRDRAAARRRRAAEARGKQVTRAPKVTREPPPAAEVVSPDDGGDGVPDGPAPSPAADTTPEAPEPEPTRVGGDGGRDRAADGGNGAADDSETGDGAEADGDDAETAGAGAGASRKSRPKQHPNRKRRKHGRR